MVGSGFAFAGASRLGKRCCAGVGVVKQERSAAAVAAALFSADRLVGPELPADDDLRALAFDRRA